MGRTKTVRPKHGKECESGKRISGGFVIFSRVSTNFLKTVGQLLSHSVSSVVTPHNLKGLSLSVEEFSAKNEAIIFKK